MHYTQGLGSQEVESISNIPQAQSPQFIGIPVSELLKLIQELSGLELKALLIMRAQANAADAESSSRHFSPSSFSLATGISPRHARRVLGRLERKKLVQLVDCGLRGKFYQLCEGVLRGDEA